MTDTDAYLLRENTGTTGLEKTARAAAEILAHFSTPHLIVGGLAVQEHGYPRLTLDVDMVVPDPQEAVDLLTGEIGGVFANVPGCEDRVQDRRNGVMVDFLPAERVLKQGCKVPFPYPPGVQDRPQFVSLEQLISLKLDSWANTPLRRSQDKADVVELISRRNLPRDLPVAAAVQSLYQDIWDGLKSEK